MKIYEMMGCSRSGHHTIINWILQNMVGFQCNWNFKLNCMSGTDVYFLGEANHDIPISYSHIENHAKDIGTLLVGYEDTPGEYTVFREDRTFRGSNSLEFLHKFKYTYGNRVLFIRDFYNNLSSRIKSNQEQIFSKWNSGEPHLFNVSDAFIFRWKSQAKDALSNKIGFIKFEDFLHKPEVRQKFLWENFGIREIYGIENIKGTKSSFGDHSNVDKRYESVEIPEETKKLIREDSELHYLIGKLGYEYRKI